MLSSLFRSRGLTGFRRLSAIEIAEGALLANVGVIFHIAALYLPQVGGFFQLMIPVLFAVLVLRRGFYVGIIGVCVSVCLVGMLTGIHGFSIMFLGCGAGLYLGITMRQRWHHFPLALVGVTSSALLVYASSFVFLWFVGMPINEYIVAFQKVYARTLASMGSIITALGQGIWWQTKGDPALIAFGQLVFRDWWIWYLIALWFGLWPMVLLIYYVTNSSVRLLGYTVRPFPGGWIERLINRLGRGIGFLVIKRRGGTRDQQEEEKE